VARPSGSESRHLAKLPPRYRQVAYSVADSNNVIEHFKGKLI